MKLSLFQLLNSKNREFGEAEEELFDAYVVKPDGGFSIYAATCKSNDLATTEARMLNAGADLQCPFRSVQR